MAKITIFGMAGTGTTTAGKALAERLSYGFESSGNMFRAKAKELEMSLQELEEASKHNSKYDIDLDKKVEEYGKTHDNFVFESRLAWHFIPDSFKVELKCDLDERIRRIAKREEKDFEKALEETKFREDTILHRYEKYYGLRDIMSESNFDLVIDTTNTGVEGVVEKIIEAIKK